MMEEVPTSVLSDHPCHLGEGPTYDVATDTAWWFDIREGKLFEAHLGGGTIRVHAPRPDGERAWADRCRAAAHRCGGWSLHPNSRRWRDDAVLSRLKRIILRRVPMIAVCIDPARSGSAPWGARPSGGAGAIYALHRGKISTLFPGISIPNSICFSPDGATGYFTDTVRAVLYAVPLNPDTGPAARGAGRVAPPHRRRRARWLRVRCRRADMERLLGRRQGRCLFSPRRAPALAACARQTGELPCFRRPRFVAPACHVRLAGYGCGGARRRPTGRPHVSATSLRARSRGA